MGAERWQGGGPLALPPALALASKLPRSAIAMVIVTEMMLLASVEATVKPTWLHCGHCYQAHC